MKPHHRFSKILHIITLCCFFLPFFYTGCQPSAAEKASSEKAKQDSVDSLLKDSLSYIEKNKNESIQKNITGIDSSNKQLVTGQSDTIANKQKDDNLSTTLSNRFPLLRLLLVPKPDTYSGIAIVINSISLINLFGTFIAFLLLAIGLSIKYIDRNTFKVSLLVDSLSLCFFTFSKPIAFSSEILWGFWICLLFISVLTIYDIYLLKISNR